MGSCVGKIFIGPSNPAGDSIVVVKDKLVVSESPPNPLPSSSSSNLLSVSSPPFAFSSSRTTKSLLSHSSLRVKPSTKQRPYTLVGDHKTASPSRVTLLGRKLSSSSTFHKQRSPQREVTRHEVEMSSVREKNSQSRSLYGSTSRQRWRKKGTRMLRVHQIQSESRIVSARSPLVEELNNPLIFLECFIFLWK